MKTLLRKGDRGIPMFLVYRTCMFACLGNVAASYFDHKHCSSAALRHT